MSFAVLKCCRSAVRALSRSGYTSAISLKTLHPNSSLKMTTPTPEQVRYNLTMNVVIDVKTVFDNTYFPVPFVGNQMPAGKEVFSGYIPIEELEIKYSTSSGPGGQNVNKVHTKVDLRFKVESAKWLNDQVRQKLMDMVSCFFTISLTNSNRIRVSFVRQ